MTGSEIIAEARTLLDDNKTIPLWSTPEIVRYLNESINEFCTYTRAIKDSSTTAVCQIAVTANTAIYALDDRILEITSAKLSGQPLPLDKTTQAEMDGSPDWQTDKGTPTHYLTDVTTGKIVLYPIPDANSTLTLSVVRLPLTQFTSSTINLSPETNFRFHSGLIDGILFRAYSKQDADTYDPQKAATHEKAFDRFLSGSRSNLMHSQSLQNVGQVNRPNPRSIRGW